MRYAIPHSGNTRTYAQNQHNCTETMHNYIQHRLNKCSASSDHDRSKDCNWTARYHLTDSPQVVNTIVTTTLATKRAPHEVAKPHPLPTEAHYNLQMFVVPSERICRLGPFQYSTCCMVVPDDGCCRGSIDLEVASRSLNFHAFGNSKCHFSM